MDAPFEKTPPKSAERIRAALDSVHQKVERKNVPGPYRDGSPPDEPLVIASFRDRDSCRRFQEALLQAGVMSSARVHRTHTEIVVEYSDRQRSAPLLDRHLEKFPDLPPQTHRRDFDFAILGTVLGATFGAIAVVADFRGIKEILVLAIFTIFGTITGAMLDRPRNRYRTTGQIQFGLGDVLVLTAVVALGFTLWRLMTAR